MPYFFSVLLPSDEDFQSNTLTNVELDVWCHSDAAERNERDIETVEAEVVYLIRKAEQWPASQTEIHFYPSSPRHREVALEIMSHYRS